jgi:hypothetical protein
MIGIPKSPTPLYGGPDRNDRDRIEAISRLPIHQLFVEWERFRVEFFSDATENDAFAIYAPAPRPDLAFLEESIRSDIRSCSNCMTPSRALWVTDVLAHIAQCLRVRAIDDELAAMPYVDEAVWYKGTFYSGLSSFIDDCIEAEDDFYESVLSSSPLPFKFIDAHNLARNCWRHMTEQAEDSDQITAEELFDQAVMDYQYLAEFEFEIEPKGLEELAEAIKTYCFVNAAQWRQEHDVASEGEEEVLSKLPESPSFGVLANALKTVEALYKEDEKLHEEGDRTIRLTEEWWISKGWKHGEV